MATYTSKLGDKICERTATSSIGLRHICKQLNMPYSTVTGWIYNKKHDLYEKYAQAKEMQIYHLAEEILEIADDSTNDYMEIVRNGKKHIVQNKEAITRSRLRIQARVTLITKLAPIMRDRKPIHEPVDIGIKTTSVLQQSKKASKAPKTPASRTSATPPSPSLPRATVEGERAGVRLQGKTPVSSPKNTSKPAPDVYPGDTVYHDYYGGSQDRSSIIRAEYDKAMRRHYGLE